MPTMLYQRLSVRDMLEACLLVAVPTLSLFIMLCDADHESHASILNTQALSLHAHNML